MNPRVKVQIAYALHYNDYRHQYLAGKGDEWYLQP
jgi:hypothetical protein